ncbi:MAG: SURF1 family protein [Lysobacter sp.]|nr:MAG: SURF1 family protein [Lysobacter sp.]
MRGIIAPRGKAVVSGRRLVGGWLFALACAALFAGLGQWQRGRAVEKERMLADAGRVLALRNAVPLAAAANGQQAMRYDWAAGRGHFLPHSGLLLDNQQHAGRVGVRAYAVFQPDHGMPLLVDLGWRPIGGDRRLPAVDIPVGARDVRGLLAPPPAPGLRIGPAMAKSGAAWLLLRVEPGAIARSLGLRMPLAPRVLRLDPALPIGYPRDLVLLANAVPPERHRGYAVQWFGLALTTLVTAVVLTFRSRR